MKFMKKIMSLALIGMFVFSLGTVISNAEYIDNTPEGYSLAYSDDQINIWTKIGPAAMQTRAGYTTQGEASPTAYHTFVCEPDEGNFCRIVVTDIDETEDMSVTSEYAIPGYDDPIYITETVGPGESVYVIIEDKNGNGIDYSVDITINAEDKSVEYEFSAEQFWSN